MLRRLLGEVYGRTGSQQLELLVKLLDTTVVVLQDNPLLGPTDDAKLAEHPGDPNSV